MHTHTHCKVYMYIYIYKPSEIGFLRTHLWVKKNGSALGTSYLIAIVPVTVATFSD